MMDSSETSTPPLTRSRKRAAEAAEKRSQGNEEVENRKRPRRMFQPRKIKSTTGLVTLIGPNDIIVNRKNPQKIKIEEEVDVKATVGVVPNVEDIEPSHIATVEPSNCGAITDFSEDEENEIAEFMGNKEVPLPLDFMEVKIEEAEVIQEGTQENGTCVRCKQLEKVVLEKDVRIKELDQELESQKQRHRDPLSKLIQEVDAPEDIVSPNAKKDKNNPVFLAILEGKPLEEIQHLVESGGDWNIPDANGDTVLHLAAKTGNSELIQYFISKSHQVNVNAPNLAGSTPLMEAAKTGTNFLSVLDVLIKNGADIKAKDGYERTMIQIAAARTGQEIEKIVSTIKNWSIENSRTREGFTVLHLTAESGNLEALKYFLSMNPNVDSQSEKKLTPLMLAASAKQNFVPIVDLLLENGADINLRDDERGYTVLDHAIKYGRPLNDIKNLITAGAPWNATNRSGSTILHTCALYGHTEALKYFIGLGANVNAVTIMETTPIWLAARRGLCDAMNLLIQNGAEFLASELLYVALCKGPVISARTPGGEKPNLYETMKRLFELGAIWNDTTCRKIVSKKRLMNIRRVGPCINNGAELAERDNHGRTPLIQAIIQIDDDYNMQANILDLLMEKGADVNAVNEEGFNALHVATRFGGCEPGRPLEIIEQLIAHGATWSNGVVGEPYWEESILHAAVRGGHPEVVQFFISKGVDINSKNYCGETPFLFAVAMYAEKFGEILRMMVEAGADPNAVDKNGNNALLHILNARNNSLKLERLKLLVALGCDCDSTIPNKEGQTVVSSLKERGYELIVKYLKSLK